MLKHNILFICGLFLSNSNVAAQSLKLMTYNVRLDVPVDGENRWSNRKDQFISQIKFYEPDILGLQESLPNQVNCLDSNLKHYKHIGIGREGVEKGESTAIFYNTIKISVLESNTFWLSETPNTISKGWDASYLRICTYGLFQEKQSKKQFWVFNTHLDNNGTLARKQSVELILNKIAVVNNNGLPVFFMGDFNTTPESELIKGLKKIMNDSKSISILKPHGPDGSFNNFEFNKPVTMLIDYIFCSIKPNVIVNKYAVLSDSYNQKYPSDHLPIFVQASLSSKQKE